MGLSLHGHCARDGFVCLIDAHRLILIVLYVYMLCFSYVTWCARYNGLFVYFLVLVVYVLYGGLVCATSMRTITLHHHVACVQYILCSVVTRATRKLYAMRLSR